MQTQDMKVMVLGYGAREHALAWKIAQSPLVAGVFVAPGNAGTAEIATNVPISDEDIPALVQYALQNNIDLTVVGTNDPLALGAVDAFQAAGLAIFGPTQTAARLESSKAFAKAFMQRHNIPTPAYAAFHDYETALDYLNSMPDGRVVVKVSGLGKMGLGVPVCDNKSQARAALRTYMVDRLLGSSAATVIIEERLEGREVSVFGLSDGRTIVPLIPVRDHKRVYDDDTGPNTGGMGAFGPPSDLEPGFMDAIMTTIMQPVIDGMAAEGSPYVGVLFGGLIQTATGVQVLEFNCRFGNPEALVLMSLLDSDLVEAMLACIDGNLTPDHIQMKDAAAAAVVISSPQYPAERFPKGLPISGIPAARALANVEVFHHGTYNRWGQLITSRGRVLAVTATAPDLPAAIEQAYRGVGRISFQGAHYRRDIGRTLLPAGGEDVQHQLVPQTAEPPAALAV
jgi:phosphoribosylamine---glycine ligase